MRSKERSPPLFESAVVDILVGALIYYRRAAPRSALMASSFAEMTADKGSQRRLRSGQTPENIH